ncbi:hypothetical protein F7725_009856 [Dissostichus mawsoni]|uniref:Uncharacterized protein n=1 Tax=Dissostichus mawsoni TaxID=36200 RepID=A0A7J5XPT7_DISMA|nr:hypothetical protein F7725_009856 [Dissostichus mawsoni]
MRENLEEPCGTVHLLNASPDVGDGFSNRPKESADGSMFLRWVEQAIIDGPEYTSSKFWDWQFSPHKAWLAPKPRPSSARPLTETEPQAPLWPVGPFDSGWHLSVHKPAHQRHETPRLFADLRVHVGMHLRNEQRPDRRVPDRLWEITVRHTTSNLYALLAFGLLFLLTGGIANMRPLLILLLLGQKGCDTHRGVGDLQRALLLQQSINLVRQIVQDRIGDFSQLLVNEFFDGFLFADVNH